MEIGENLVIKKYWKISEKQWKWLKAKLDIVTDKIMKTNWDFINKCLHVKYFEVQALEIIIFQPVLSQNFHEKC